MNIYEIEIEHKFKGKLLGVYKFSQSKPLITVGSMKNADLRLLGEKVSPIHATIEFDNNAWTVNDVSSESGVWIDKVPQISHSLEKTSWVTISGHNLRVTPIFSEKTLFSKAEEKTLENKNNLYQQVVVKKHNTVIETKLIKPKSVFTYEIGQKKISLEPVNSASWTSTEFDNIEILQRLTESEVLSNTKAESVKEIIDKDMRAPLAGALLILALFLSLTYFMPKDPSMDNISTPVNIEKNKFTKIIYKAKTKKEKEKSAKKIKKLMAGKANKKTPKAAPIVKNKPARKVTLKKGRSNSVLKSNKTKISALLGKIANRASKNAIQVVTPGEKASLTKSLGGALSNGTKVANVKNAGGGGGKAHSLTGVSTNGKSGGTGSYRKLSGFSTGAVGGSNVGIIEEETEIQGGLSKDQIAAVIRSNLGQIRYCYERQLSSNPELYGKVLVKFTINAKGLISKNKIRKTTLKNKLVEGCIKRKMAKWKFPKPVGGTQVKVSYPFLFKSTN